MVVAFVVFASQSLHLPTPHTSTRRCFVASGLAVATLGPAKAAFGKYGEFARTDGVQGVLAAGDPNNECLFATPGTGICQVYKSSQPSLYDAPNLQGAKVKALAAIRQLNTLDSDIEQSRWTAISQALGASRDLRESVGFLTAGRPEAAAIAKKLYLDLDGIYLAAQKKDKKVCQSYFDKYVKDAGRLVAELEAAR